MAKKPSESTGKAAAAAASKVLRSPTATKAEKTAAGSALNQRGGTEVTGKKAAAAASEVLRSPTASKAAKSAAASALTQRPGKKKG